MKRVFAFIAVITICLNAFVLGISAGETESEVHLTPVGQFVASNNEAEEIVDGEALMRSDTEYHIAFQSDGKMLSCLSGSYSLCKQYYSNTIIYQKWVFTTIESGKYVIRSKQNTDKCLTAIPGTSVVTVSDFTSGNTNQYWSMNGGSLCSKSTDSSLTNKKLYYTGGSFTLSSSNYSKLAFLEVSAFVPCTSMELPDEYVALNSTVYLHPKAEPENAYNAGWVLKYTPNSSSYYSISEAGYLTGLTLGSDSFTIKNRITGVSCTTTIHIHQTLPKKYGQNKSNWCWVASTKKAGVHNGGDGSQKGAELLTNTSGVYSYSLTDFYGYLVPGQKTADAEQRAIVIDRYGSDANTAGSIQDMVYALQHASDQSLSIGVTVTATGATSSSIQTIISAVNNDIWVVGGVSTASGSGHAIVFTAYYPSQEKFVVWDPAIDGTYSVYVSDMLNNTIHLNSDPINRKLDFIMIGL